MGNQRARLEQSLPFPFSPLLSEHTSGAEKRKTASCPFSWWLPCQAGTTSTSWGEEAEWDNGGLPQAWQTRLTWQKAKGRKQVIVSN